MPSIKVIARRIHNFLNHPQIEVLLIVLAVLLILRIPNLFEPYWYGDEGIYLTVGHALSRGAHLYVDIVDHKTPIIYYLAMMPSQLAFRVLFLLWMLITTGAFYALVTKWLKGWLPIIGSTLFFLLLTTLPFLEGNIPNGELFVMGFVLIGATLIAYSPLANYHEQTKVTLSRFLTILAAGVFFGLGILTKVPAVFDMAAFVAFAWFSAAYHFFHSRPSVTGHLIKHWLMYVIALVLGTALAIGYSVFYFVSKGSGQAYLDFGLLYNLRYAGEFSAPFTQPLLVFAFSLKGKVVLTALIGVILTLAAKWFKPWYLTILFWCILSIFAATLSNRPYPHYLLQAIPPLAVLIGYVLQTIQTGLKHKHLPWLSFQLLPAVLIFVLSVSMWWVLKFGGYPTLSYYTHFAELLTGQMTAEQYANSFNYIIPENRAVSRILRQSPDPYLFIWGTDPMLYAQSYKQPVGKFTVAFHIKDFNAYDETLAAIKAKKPYFIVVMNEDAHTFPALNQYLQAVYLPNMSYDHMTVWKLKQLR